ncbi:precorrin-4 C(11)-methyltransferase [Hippea alviniae]|uniref:precorrin-4 C(11)-methyltransferase n=1 Tax=Hippea alviniae TaxID=1279027 RepID=UPI0003B783AE|nr:precorrin-4 C(11)-methyltransferase [Hippea alviniae]
MGKVYFIGAGPGDIELLTIKAVKILKRSDVVIYAGSLVNGDILSFTKKDAKVFDSSSMTLKEIINTMIDACKNGYDVARLHSGDPSIYGAIAEQMKELEKFNIEYEIIPGITSLFAAASKLKVQLTAPEISQTVVITRLEGRTKMPEDESIDKILSHGGTFCFYLSVDKLKEIVDACLRAGFDKDTPVAVCYRIGWKDEKIVKGNLKDITKKASGINRQALVIVGKVLNRDISNYSKLYDENFSHGYRKNSNNIDKQ